jgi:subtilase family serine protease
LPNDLLDAMLTYSNTVHQLSCSWGWGGGPSNTTEEIFQFMDAVGQSFFNASGDTDAFTAGDTSDNSVDNPELQNAPSSSPSITQVGGTTLTMAGTGQSYTSETVWNWGAEYGAGYDGIGSSGGVSSYYPMPWWQTNVSDMAACGGSLTNRDIPDVALTGDNVFEYDGGNQTPDLVGGTSCSAPLWAGFMALVNQSAAAGGWPEVGFINPAIYALAASSSYSSCFHDITTGNNTWSGSRYLFHATNNYDLCTGLGTPNGMFLIAALGGDTLGFATGGAGYDFEGPLGGPFSPTAATFTLTNTSTTALNWTVINNASWLRVGGTGGSLAARESTNVTIPLLAGVTNYATGYYMSSLIFSNATLHVFHKVPVTLEVLGDLPGLTAVWDNGVQLTWNTVAGQTYQVQYKTNLDQADWNNLGSSVTASAVTVSVTDTNGVQSLPQRFYRVSLVQ